MKKTPISPIPHDCISFRLQKEVAAELTAKAARAGVSPNILARDLMTAALLKPADQQQRSIDSILAELGRIRTALSATNGQRPDAEPTARLLSEIHKMLSAYFNRHEEKAIENLDMLRSEIAEVLCDLPQISKLRSDLASSVIILLSNAGKVPREQAEAWVESAFLDD